MKNLLTQRKTEKKNHRYKIQDKKLLTLKKETREENQKLEPDN